MSVSNGVISAPVSIDDVNNTIGAGSTDLGTLCQWTNINHFAKYKPVVLDSFLGSLDPGNFAVDNYNSIPYKTNWWRGKNGHCGFEIGTVTELVTSTSSDPIWSTIVPTTNFRLLDWEGYDAYANKEMFSIGVGATAMVKKGFRVSVRIPQPSGGSGLTLPDIFSTEAFGTSDIKLVIKVCANPNSGDAATREIPITSESTIFTFSDDEMYLSGATAGATLYVHVFMKDHKGVYRSLRYDSSAKTVYTLKLVSTEKYTVDMGHPSVLRYLQSNPWVYQVKHPMFRLDASNYSGGTATSNTIKMYRYISDDTNYIQENPLWEYTVPTTTVDAGSVVTIYESDGFDVDISHDSYAREKVIFIWWEYSTEIGRNVVDVKRYNS